MKPETKAFLSLSLLVLIFLAAIVPVFYGVAFLNYFFGFAIPFNAVMIGLMIGLGFKARQIIDKIRAGAAPRDK